MNTDNDVTRQVKRGTRATAQRAGCLPAGFTEDSWLSVAQFLRWVNRSPSWFARRKRNLPGVLCRSRKDVQVHVGAHLRGVFKK